MPYEQMEVGFTYDGEECSIEVSSDLSFEDVQSAVVRSI